MRINLICLILLSTLPILRGQNFDLNLEGTSWVKTKVTLASGKEVPIDDELRYSYLKYTFNKNTMLVSNDFREKGSKMAYTLEKNELRMFLEANVLSPALVIVNQTTDSLIIEQYSWTYGSTARLSFVNETLWRKSHPLQIAEATENDTLYIANAFQYPQMKDYDSFEDYLSKKMKKKIRFKMNRNFFIADFTINKIGNVEDIKIRRGVNADFDSAFVKICLQTSGKWTPCTQNGKPISVKVNYDTRLFSNEMTQSAVYWLGVGRKAMLNKKYDDALYAFLESMKRRYDLPLLWYYKGLCNLKNKDYFSACSDFKKVKEFGSVIANEMLENVCEK